MAISCSVATLARRWTDDGGGDDIVKNAVDLEADHHVSDRHMAGIDHAGRLFERGRLAHLP